MTISELFTDKTTVSKIQKRLPESFYFAELESSRAGKVGMEVGSVREKVLIALLLYKLDALSNIHRRLNFQYNGIEQEYTTILIDAGSTFGKRIKK